MEWGFKELSKDEPRNLGRNNFAIDRKIHNLVREAIQNVRDQGIHENDKVRVTFKLIDLTDSELVQFQKDIGWNNGLQGHLQVIANGRTVHEQGLIKDNLAKAKKGTMRVLIISDSNTKGLTGPEFGIEGNFCKLCRNEMIPSEGASNAKNGGAFGVGKSAYWNFSGIRTVVFSSVYKESDADQSKSRVFGRTYLPDHNIEITSTTTGAVESIDYSGDAFLCKLINENGVDLRSSMTFEEAGINPGSLLFREADDFGTTIAVVLFDEREDDQSVSEIADELHHAIVVNFWPMIEGKLLDATVEWRVGTEIGSIQIGIPDELKAYVRAANVDQTIDAFAQNSPVKLLEESEIAHFNSDIEIPARHVEDETKHNAFVGQLAIGVTRLSEEESNKLKVFQERYKDAGISLINRFAYIRSARMVVDYEELVDGNCNNHVGVIRAGTFRQADRSEITEEDKMVEQFLRDSEPPMHNHWKFWEKISSNYKRGARSSVEKSFAAITVNARKLLKPVLQGVNERPKGLADKLRIRKGTDTGPDGGKRGVQVKSQMESVIFDLKSKDATCRVRIKRTGQVPSALVGKPWTAVAGISAIGESGDEKLHLLGLKLSETEVEAVPKGTVNNVQQYEITMPDHISEYVVDFAVSLANVSDAVLERIRVVQFANYLKPDQRLLISAAGAAE
jgi:hypothetical protein